MKKKLLMFTSFTAMISCERNKSNDMNNKEFYYSLKNNENILLTTNYYTIITDRGIFPLEDSLDDEKSNRYHLIYKRGLLGI